jgi:hypothetical protein
MNNVAICTQFALDKQALWGKILLACRLFDQLVLLVNVTLLILNKMG